MFRKRKAPRRAGLCRNADEAFLVLRHADGAAVLGAFDGELHGTVDKREQGVVAAEADAVPRMELGTALTHDDVTGFHGLAAVDLHAEVFRIGVAAVTSTAACLFMCHD